MTYVKRRAGSPSCVSHEPFSLPWTTQDLVRVEWENMERLRAVRWKCTVIEVLSDACQMYVHGCLPLPMLRA